jgi:ATP-dependent Clp protease ATP-binding subunit ClpX
VAWQAPRPSARATIRSPLTRTAVSVASLTAGTPAANVMYEVPARGDVAKVVITRDTVLRNVNPTLVPRERPYAGDERPEKSA